MSRIHLILAVFLALTCTGLAAAADSPSAPPVSQRPDGRLLPDSADIPRADLPTPGASSETSGATSRHVPDAADLRKDEAPPIVVFVDRESTASFDWLDALVGALAAAGVALAVGGVLVARYHVPSPAR